MKGKTLLCLGLSYRPNKNRDKSFYRALGASSADVFLIKFINFLKYFLPLLVITVLVLYFCFPDLWYNITHVYEVFRA